MFTILVAAAVAVFCIGVLAGNGYTTHAQVRRSRAQALKRRDLERRLRAVHDLELASRAKLAWLTAQQDDQVHTSDGNST